jgi:hypothetical protein
MGCGFVPRSGVRAWRAREHVLTAGAVLADPVLQRRIHETRQDRVGAHTAFQVANG